MNNLTGSIPTETCEASKLFRVAPDVSCKCCKTSENNENMMLQDQCYEETQGKSWLTTRDDNLHHHVSTQRGCDWFELYDLGCEQHGMLTNSLSESALHKCCYCNQCTDYSDFKDVWGDGCRWYIENENYGCDVFGDTKNK